MFLINLIIFFFTYLQIISSLFVNLYESLGLVDAIITAGTRYLTFTLPIIISFAHSLTLGFFSKLQLTFRPSSIFAYIIEHFHRTSSDIGTNLSARARTTLKSFLSRFDPGIRFCLQQPPKNNFDLSSGSWAQFVCECLAGLRAGDRKKRLIRRKGRVPPSTRPTRARSQRVEVNNLSALGYVPSLEPSVPCKWRFNEVNDLVILNHIPFLDDTSDPGPSRSDLSITVSHQQYPHLPVPPPSPLVAFSLIEGGSGSLQSISCDPFTDSCAYPLTLPSTPATPGFHSQTNNSLNAKTGSSRLSFDPLSEFDCTDGFLKTLTFDDQPIGHSFFGSVYRASNRSRELLAVKIIKRVVGEEHLITNKIKAMCLAEGSQWTAELEGW